MAEIIRFVFDALGSLLTLYGAAYVLALSRPLLFYEHFASGDVPPSKLRAAIVYTLVILKILAIGFFFYHGAYGIFEIIPRDWMRYDEDGEVMTSISQYFQILAAMIGTAIALSGEGKVAREGQRLLEERLKEHGY